MRTDGAGYMRRVSGVRQERTYEVECPHCHKSFAGEPIEGGRAARYLGFKCPHCKLFVPLGRATDLDLPEQPLSRDTDA
jgi:phage FluMu protein Com